MSPMSCCCGLESRWGFDIFGTVAPEEGGEARNQTRTPKPNTREARQTKPKNTSEHGEG